MKKNRVSEAAPVQVYLDPQDRGRLERLAQQLGATKSDILRRGLQAVEREVFSPASHPALKLIGLAESERPAAPTTDAAVAHDQLLADAEEASWRRPAGQGRRRGR